MRECAKKECHPESIIGKRVIREKEGKRERVEIESLLMLHVDSLLIAHTNTGLLRLLSHGSRLMLHLVAISKLLKSMTGGKVRMSKCFIGTNSLCRIKFEKLF